MLTKSKVQQHFAGACDINAIMARYRQSGQLAAMPSMRSAQGLYGDFSRVGSFHEALSAVQAAKEQFATLPAPVRSRFRNDPGSLLYFLSDEDNFDEAVKLGLVAPPVLPVTLPGVVPVNVGSSGAVAP